MLWCQKNHIVTADCSDPAFRWSIQQRIGDPLQYGAWVGYNKTRYAGAASQSEILEAEQCNAVVLGKDRDNALSF